MLLNQFSGKKETMQKSKYPPESLQMRMHCTWLYSEGSQAVQVLKLFQLSYKEERNR